MDTCVLIVIGVLLFIIALVVIVIFLIRQADKPVPDPEPPEPTPQPIPPEPTPPEPTPEPTPPGPVPPEPTPPNSAEQRNVTPTNSVTQRNVTPTSMINGFPSASQTSSLRSMRGISDAGFATGVARSELEAANAVTDSKRISVVDNNDIKRISVTSFARELVRDAVDNNNKRPIVNVITNVTNITRHPALTASQTSLLPSMRGISDAEAANTVTHPTLTASQTSLLANAVTAISQASQTSLLANDVTCLRANAVTQTSPSCSNRQQTTVTAASQPSSRVNAVTQTSPPCSNRQQTRHPAVSHTSLRANAVTHTRYPIQISPPVSNRQRNIRYNEPTLAAGGARFEPERSINSSISSYAGSADKQLHFTSESSRKSSYGSRDYNLFDTRSISSNPTSNSADTLVNGRSDIHKQERRDMRSQEQSDVHNNVCEQTSLRSGHERSNVTSHTATTRSSVEAWPNENRHDNYVEEDTHSVASIEPMIPDNYRNIKHHKYKVSDASRTLSVTSSGSSEILDDIKALDLASHSNSNLALLSPTKIYREYTDNSCRPQNITTNISIQHLQSFAGELYAISTGQIYTLNVTTYESNCWHFARSEHHNLQNLMGIIHTSASLDGKLLWIQNSETGYSLDAQLNLLHTSAILPDTVRVYGKTSSQYITINTKNCTATATGIASVTGNELSNVCRGVISYSGKITSISPAQLDQYKDVKLLNWKPTYIRV